MAKPFKELIGYFDRSKFPKPYRPWIIRHLALARNQESSLDEMVSRYPYEEPLVLPLAVRLKREPLRVLIRDGVVAATPDGRYRLNARLTPNEITTLVARCDQRLRAWNK